MIGRKLAVLAASLAGGAVLTWTVVETLRDGRVEPRSTIDAEADSPIARLAARMGPPDHGLGAAFAASEGDGWRAWDRSAAELAAADATGAGNGLLGDRNGQDFWNAWARGLDRADAAAWAAMRNPDYMAGPPHREPALRGRQPYHLPETGQRTILTSGHLLGQPDIRLPHNVDVTLARYTQQPVRVEVCVNRAGKPKEARVVDGTGVAKVDNFIALQMLEGRYRPLWENGRPVAFCERTTVVIGS
jgi:hypothetical protein